MSWWVITQRKSGAKRQALGSVTTQLVTVPLPKRSKLQQVHTASGRLTGCSFLRNYRRRGKHIYLTVR